MQVADTWFTISDICEVIDGNFISILSSIKWLIGSSSDGILLPQLLRAEAWLVVVPQDQKIISGASWVWRRDEAAGQ